MSYLRVSGGGRLSGELDIGAAKNAVLPIIACSILCEDEINIQNCAPLSDILAMLRIIRKTGGRAEYKDGGVYINCRDSVPVPIDGELTGGIRSSIFILGPILARFGRAQVCYPGGCEIGLRPIDLHLSGLKKLNVRIKDEGGLLVCDGRGMAAGEVDLDFPSVGATENIMMAAVFLKGTSVIRNAAREPEIVDLAGFINAMGGRVSGAGTDTVHIEGVKRLAGRAYTPISDRIAGGTFLTACAMAGGDVRLNRFNPGAVNSLTEKLIRAGMRVERGAQYMRIKSEGRIRAIHKIETQPYPGFPTDMQAQTVAMLTLAQGASMMVENLFENRFKYTVQLNKMGADITVKDRMAVVKGVKRLNGSVVTAEDLRGGAALVMAALAADGVSYIGGVDHIDRGYYQLEEDFKRLGGDVKRVEKIH
ncbi:MAG: UDP-N-acetylglucosamine 1-carboxyvinyltransferase [Clostridiales bacterium]|jgi:UDP-N-acetylglucosamine 1-carboxyvinyltransferase|nr:UDP-N-acetylglucosamine 1-carboxyvinyltransferase [Clostridiales bacterium]